MNNINNKHYARDNLDYQCFDARNNLDYQKCFDARDNLDYQCFDASSLYLHINTWIFPHLNPSRDNVVTV